MHTSGRNKGGRRWVAFAAVAVLAGVALAAEVSVVDVPATDAYTVAAQIVPGSGGADICGDEKPGGHVDFRVGFGSDLRLSVNGADAGAFDPAASYLVTVDCRKIGLGWFATTRIVNQGTGAQVYEQVNFLMPRAPEQVRAVAESVIALSVQ